MFSYLVFDHTVLAICRSLAALLGLTLSAAVLVMRFVRNRHHVLFHWTEALPASRPTQPCIGLCSDRSAVTGGNRPIAVAERPVRTPSPLCRAPVE